MAETSKCQFGYCRVRVIVKNFAGLCLISIYFRFLMNVCYSKSVILVKFNICIMKQVYLQEHRKAKRFCEMRIKAKK